MEKLVLKQLPKFGEKNTGNTAVLQRALNHKGYRLATDDNFGPKTSEAVIDFKKKNGFYPSNIVAEWIIDLLGVTLLDTTPEIERDEILPDVKEHLDDDEDINIIKVAGTHWQSKGKFHTKSGRPMGLLLHYAVSGNNKAAAINMVRYFANTPKTLGYQLACPFLDKDGIFYTSENWKFFDDWNNNAGSSSFKGLTNVSKYFLGLEVLNWGMLDGTNRAASLPKEELVTFPSNKENIKKGTYQLITKAQLRAIVNLVKKMKKECPDFSLVYLTSHDVVAPSRKSDIGGSLGMTISEFIKMCEKELAK